MNSLRSSIVFAALLMCTCAQRPFYASSGGQYPGVLPQNQPSTSATDLDFKFGENNPTTPSNSYVAYQKDPVYNVDRDLVERIKNEYPPDKQPYWYLNAAHINNSRYQQQQVQVKIQELEEELKRLQDAERRMNAQQQQPRQNN